MLSDRYLTATGPSKVEDAKSAGEDAASAVKSAVPDQPKDAAKDAASAIKENLPEAPKDIPNPLQNLFGKRSPALFGGFHVCHTHALGCFSVRLLR